ncbi:hypothetical protein EYF80_013225 [Liparis tanakae]|uniref:Uncharacterized protein n=1 Tax=Liparis tanakae TaxID=230148 RepID=A0A4Z2IG02_9TELE|nr:hypothetical protein EYF80_013225 [Liparis tanakae]
MDLSWGERDKGILTFNTHANAALPKDQHSIIIMAGATPLFPPSPWPFLLRPQAPTQWRDDLRVNRWTLAVSPIVQTLELIKRTSTQTKAMVDLRMTLKTEQHQAHHEAQRKAEARGEEEEEEEEEDVTTDEMGLVATGGEVLDWLPVSTSSLTAEASGPDTVTNTEGHHQTPKLPRSTAQIPYCANQSINTELSALSSLCGPPPKETCVCCRVSMKALSSPVQAGSQAGRQAVQH